MNPAINELKENDVIFTNYYPNHPLLIIKNQKELEGLRLIPLIFYEKYKNWDEKIAGASIKLLEKIPWNYTLINDFKSNKNINCKI